MGIIRLDAAEDSLSTKLASSNAELSILAGVDSSAYVVWDDLNTPLALRTFDHAPYANWYSEERLFVTSFKQVRIGWCGHTALLVPARLFDPTRPELYLQQLTLLPQGMEVQAEAIAELDAYLVFAIPKALPELWQQMFVRVRYTHILATMLRPLQQHAAKQGGELIHAYIQPKDIRLFAWRDGKLLFTNVFNCQSARDFLYFSLLAFDQTSCRPSITPMYLMGELTEDAEIYRSLYRYIKELRFLPYPEGSQALGPKLASYPHHLFVAPSWLHTHL